MIDHFTSILADQPIEGEFDRIKNNHDVSSNNIPYTIKYINMLIRYFELKEEYEKCQVLTLYKSNKLDHNKKFKDVFLEKVN
jgi:hypothetical protein